MFLYEKERDKKDNHEYIVIKGYEGSAKELIIPDRIDGLPVEAIGSHAFSSRQDIEKVALPPTIRTLRSYVFHNSRSLKKISLFDSIDDYYDGVCRQCDSLEEVEITIERNWYEVVRNFLADTDKALRFLIHISSQEKECVDSCLSFPGYVYDFNENTMARTIQFSIAGSGYAYRECVDRRKIDYRQYDNLFSKARIDGGSICEDIAIGRLLYPVELEDRFRKEYESYISDKGYAILERLIDKAKDSHDAQELLGKVLDLRRQESTGSESLVSLEDQDKAMEHAVSLGSPRITSLLMEKGRKDSECQSDYLHF